MAKILNLKYPLILFWLISFAAGTLFAVIIDANTGEVIAGTNGQFLMPSSRMIWLVCCSVAYLCQAASYSIISGIAREEDDEIPVLLFWGQFFLVIVWLGLYFGLHLAGVALFDLFAAILIIVFAFSEFRAMSTAAALLMLPYIGLVCFLLFMNIYTFLI